MGIIAVPDLRTPFPSRINPLADEAEQEARSFMRRFGLVTTDKAAGHYDAHRFGEQTARCYPEAEMAELEILVGWMTTAFILDDYLEALGDWCDKASFKQVIRTVQAWIGLGECDAAHAGTPLAAALADLWGRTAARTSARWQKRFLTSLTDYHRGCEEEAALRLIGHVGDVASSISLRRDNAAPRFGFTLGELAGRYELPDALVGDPRMVAVQRAASDAITIGNDIVGLEADLVGGVRNNTVLAILNEHGGTLQEAADEAARVFQAMVEELVWLESDLPACYDELGLAGPARADAEAYLRTLHDWIEGGLAWQRRSGRYQILDRLTEADLPNPLAAIAGYDALDLAGRPGGR